MGRIIRLLFLTIIFLFAVIASTNGQDSKPGIQHQKLDIPQPQGFCGYCHILTYPEVINKNYLTWQKGKHNKVGCIECHYQTKMHSNSGAPNLASQKVKPPPVPETPPAHFSFLGLGGKTVKTEPQIADASCMTAACHGKPEDTFRTKKIMFTDKVPFTHDPHFDKKNQIEGMQVNCTTCHQHETDNKHFEVAEAACHLCHFANVRFNQGRAKCELCHQLPVNPIQAVQAADKKPITHQMLKEAGVSCISCHFDLIQGFGETKVEPFFEGNVIKTSVQLGAGRLKPENCRSCHDQASYLSKAGDKKEMHTRHVTAKNARCFACHQPVGHRKKKINQPMPDDCTACHPESHRYQRLLAEGPERAGISANPDPMFLARTSCLACHIEKDQTHKGEKVLKASARTCVQCHTKDYEKMLELWKRELGREIEKVQQLEKEALGALKKHKAEVTEEKLKEANRMFQEARSNLGIVRFGNGIHNAKYAVALLDEASVMFKDAISYMEGKGLSEGPIRQE